MSSWKIHYLKLTNSQLQSSIELGDWWSTTFFQGQPQRNALGFIKLGTSLRSLVNTSASTLKIWVPGFRDQGGPISREKKRGTNHTIPLKSKGVLQIGGWPGLLSICQAGSWSQHFQQSPGIPLFAWVRVGSQSHTGTVGRFVSAVPVDGLFHCNSCPVLISESEHPFNYIV